MASWARTARLACAQGVRGLLQTQEGQLVRAAQSTRQQSRGFAAGHGHEGVTHEGLTIHKAASWHVYVGKGFASLMWFWVFYRFYNDFDHFVYGPAAHMEHELHEEAHHGEEGQGSGGEHH